MILLYVECFAEMKNKTSLFVIILAIAALAVFFLLPERGASPSVPSDGGNGVDKSNLIRVDSPLPNQEVSSPLVVKGQARGTWYFEASFPVRLLDGTGKEIAVVPAQAEGDWMTEEFVPFKAELKFDAPGIIEGTLVLEKDNPSGLPENVDQISIPVRFTAQENPSSSGGFPPIGQTITVKAFFNNSKQDPEFSCNKVFPVSRVVPKTSAVARAALEELLKGSSREEMLLGFTTNINPGVKIQELTIKDSVARVDFNEVLDNPGGGSCRVAAIRAQITETIKQFPAVKDVVISINGRTEDILQP